MRKVITEELKTEIREFYKKRPITIECMAKKFGLCNITITRILGDIPLWPKTLIFNPDLDERYFYEIDTEEKAYFVGLIIADGNIFDPINSVHHGSKWVSIMLQNEDAYMLEIFRNQLHLRTKVSEDGRGSSYIAARSDKLADSLKKYGIVERKSFNTMFPFNIDQKFYRHVVRGIFDGDGSIYTHHSPSDPRNRYKHKMSFCGTKRLMEELVDVLNRNIKVTYPIKVYSYKTRCLSEFRVSNINDMYEFGKWIYEDATIYLKRKHDKFNQFIAHYGLDEVNTGYHRNDIMKLIEQP